jgi:hypothetical protein
MNKSRCMSLAGGVSNSWFLSIVCATLLSAFGVTTVQGQDAQDEMKSGPTASDYAAAEDAHVIYRHAKPANTAAGATLKQKQIAERAAAASARATPSTDDNDQLRFPADLTYNGGAVVRVAESHAIFLLPNGKCPMATCWGNPEGFLRDLNTSEFVHITDQYVSATANGRYPVGGHLNVSYKPTSKTAPLTDADLQAFVHKAVLNTFKGQAGYSHIYHVFLPPGQDVCFTAKDGICYSPDVPATFSFCGYHSSMDFSDVGHVLYTVEPFQNVAGCSVRPGTPNGQQVDSTNNTLSHEAFETITDPDGTAWFNFTSVVLQFQEIGDECSFFVTTPTGAFFGPSVSMIGLHRYAVQPEYTNSEHACASNP